MAVSDRNLSALKFEFHRIFSRHKMFLWLFFNHKNVKPILSSDLEINHACFFFHAGHLPAPNPPSYKSKSFRNFNLILPLPVPSIFLHRLPAPKLLGTMPSVWPPVVHTACAPRDVQRGLLFIFSTSVSCLSSRLYISEGQSLHFMSLCDSWSHALHLLGVQ